MDQNQNAHGASAADGSHEPSALPHLPGISQAAPPDTAAPPDDPDFTTDEQADAYWQGVADGIRQVGGIVPSRLAARAAPGGLLVPMHDSQILPGTGRWQTEGLTEGAHPFNRDQPEGGTPATTGFPGGPPPRSGEECSDPDDILAFTPADLRARHDGWTPEKQVAFVEALADTGIIRAAAARVKMTPQSVSRLRRRKDARAFDLACRTAEQIGRRGIVSVAWERAIEGTIRRHYFHGELKSEERVYSERLLIALLNRLPPDPQEDKQAETIEQNWDDWMDAIAEGRDAPATPEPEAEPTLAPEDAKVWEDEDELLTDAPPPPGYDGYADGEYGDACYQRHLTEAEEHWWQAEGETAAREQPGMFGPQWLLERPTFFPWGCEPSAPFAAAAEPEGKGSEATAPSGERPARPADGSSPDEPDRRHGFAGTAPVAEPEAEASEADSACSESRPSAADGSSSDEPDRRHGFAGTAPEAEPHEEQSEASEASDESRPSPGDGSPQVEPDRRHGFAGTPHPHDPDGVDDQGPATA